MVGGKFILVVLVASVVFGDPGGHGSEEVRRSRGEEGLRGTTEQSGRQHKSLSSHPPAFDQVHRQAIQKYSASMALPGAL